MSNLKRDFKIRDAKDKFTNDFYLENLDAQVSLQIHFFGNHWFVCIYIYDNYNYERMEESLPYDHNLLKSLIESVKEVKERFKSGRERVVWKKYQDQNFKVGVVE